MCKHHFLKIGEIKAGAELCCISWYHLLIIAVAAGLLFRFFSSVDYFGIGCFEGKQRICLCICAVPSSVGLPRHTGWWLLPLDLAACSSGKMKTLILPGFRYGSFLSCIGCLLPFTTNSQPPSYFITNFSSAYITYGSVGNAVIK